MRIPAHLLGLIALSFACLELSAPCILHADTVMYRVNAGGPSVASLDAGPAWSRDLIGANASPYVNAAATTDQIFGSSAAPGSPHTSVPAYVPSSIFADERWDPGTSPEMQWEFPVTNGTYRVNLMMMEGYSGTQFVGARRINVTCEGATRLSNYDIFALYGGYTPAMETFLTVVGDGSLSLVLHHIADDPAIRGIEIISVSSAGAMGAAPSGVAFGPRLVNTVSPPQNVTITNLGSPGDSSLAIGTITVPAGYLSNLSPQTLAPGESRTFQVRFAPNALGTVNANLTISYNGGAGTLSVPLSGEAVGSFPVAFGKSSLQLGQRTNPTSLQFGSDGRLYVAQKDGTLYALTVQRNGANNYAVTQTEVINVIRALPNRNDDGSLNLAITERLVTGLLVTGPPAAPVIYVTSSDPRMNVAGDINLDTNSGILSRLDRVGSVWSRTDLVRGLPRSENDHCPNGMALDTLTNTLYVGQPGNANMGAPSLNFSFLPEYALTAAILSVDLDAIGNTTYDLPTLDDEDRPGVVDANDPFGGNDGKNQAIIVPGGPVQVYSPGYRNPYDVLIHTNGHLYTIDNGPNAGWGGPPVGAGPGGNCTNADNDNDSQSLADNLHMIPAAGFYAGHPNPTRANVSNTFNASNPQSPVPFGNPVECEYRVPGTDGSLAQWNASTNGLVEYRASNFGGALQGALLAT
ncbi:MAG: choice-of-anchor D domain-containing protein, partial [Candidatus Eisenbacteria bacterium]